MVKHGLAGRSVFSPWLCVFMSAPYLETTNVHLGGGVLDASSIELKAVHAVAPAEIARVGANAKRSTKD